jgi:hypothetical protein
LLNVDAHGAATHTHRGNVYSWELRKRLRHAFEEAFAHDDNAQNMIAMERDPDSDCDAEGEPKRQP